MPCLWAASGDFNAFDAALESDPTVERIVETEAISVETYYQLEWSNSVNQFIDALIDAEGSVLNAEVHGGEWELRIRFATRDQLEDFQNHLSHQNHPFQLLNLIEPDSSRQERGELTAAQRDALSRTFDYCQEHGIALDFLNLYRLEDGRHGRFGLTDEQHEVLALAYEHGYYAVPRKVDAIALADEVGISHQAVCERLRRVHGNLAKKR